MSSTKITDKPIVGTHNENSMDYGSQVILYNDDHNAAEYVVVCLMRIFGHNQHLAAKIMLEAHTKGRAIAETEDGQKAQLHKDQLQSYGLTAAVEQV